MDVIIMFQMCIQMVILTPHIHPQYGQGMALHITGHGDGDEEHHHPLCHGTWAYKGEWPLGRDSPLRWYSPSP